MDKCVVTMSSVIDIMEARKPPCQGNLPEGNNLHTMHFTALWVVPRSPGGVFEPYNFLQPHIRVEKSIFSVKKMTRKYQIACVSTTSITPCGWEVEYTHRIPACSMRRLKRCPDDSSSISVGPRRHPVYSLPGYRSKTLTTFSNLSCQIPTQPLLHMVQHVADWVASFPP